MASKVLIRINDILKGKIPTNIKRSSEWDKVRKLHLEKIMNVPYAGALKS